MIISSEFWPSSKEELFQVPGFAERLVFINTFRSITVADLGGLIGCHGTFRLTTSYCTV